MNVTINSQVQSPFVRTLEAVPTLSGSFTHHIPDNTPPVSMTRISQAAVDTSSIEAAGEKVFNIPQYGYLHKVVARVRGTLTAKQASGGGAGADLYPKFFDDGAYGLIDEVSLNTRNRPIERMYGRQMFADAVSGDAGQTSRKLDMASFHITSYDATGTGATTDNMRRRLGHRVGYNETLVHYGTAGNDILDAATDSGPAFTGVIDSYVELPFSSTQTLASNFNTRFVEPITVNLKTLATSVMHEAAPLIQSAAAVVDGPQAVWTVELLCYFLNYHDLTESDIRDNNFKPDAPAVVFGSDVRQEPSTPITAIDHQVANAVTNEVTYTVDVRSNNICKELLVLASPNLDGGANYDDYGLGNLSLRNRFQVLKNIRFTGSGQELYNATGYEALMVDRFDHALSTWSNQRADGFSTNGYNGAAEIYTLALPVYKIQFGLSSDPTYNSGCIGLQTVSNPQVEVVVQGQIEKSDLLVYVKHHALVQIDSGTGAISRSIDA